MGPKKKTIFNNDWLHDPRLEYIESVPKDPHSGYCKLCCKIFDLSNMGIRALVSHVGGKKHERRLENAKQSKSIQLHFPTSNTTHQVKFISRQKLKFKKIFCTYPHPPPLFICFAVRLPIKTGEKLVD